MGEPVARPDTDSPQKRQQWEKDLDAWASQRILGLSRQRLASYHRDSSARMHDLSQKHAIITELLRPECVEPALASKTKPSVLSDMVALAERTGLVVYAEELLASLEERERLCSTGLPGGLALLHPRHHDPYTFADSFLALGRTVHPIHFGAPDGDPSDLFFLVCCQDDRIHLHVLARLCAMCMQTRMIALLREAPDAPAMRGVVVKAEEEVTRELSANRGDAP